MNYTLLRALILGFITLLFVAILLLGISGNTQCRREDSAMKESIDGKVINVFRDSTHHNYETLTFLMDSENKRSYILRSDQSGIFDYLLPGDSIVKREQNLVMEVFRDGAMVTFALHYECDRK
jgi:hypothetical protein